MSFMHRNREYIWKDFRSTSLIEYIDDLIGSDEKHCDMEGIRGHIERLFLPNILLTISLLELWNVKIGLIKV